MAVKTVNNITGPNRLVPTLLVYRAYPKMSNLDPSALSITEQVSVIRKAIAEIVVMRCATHTCGMGWRAYKTFQPAVRPVAGHCCYLFSFAWSSGLGLAS